MAHCNNIKRNYSNIKKSLIKKKSWHIFLINHMYNSNSTQTFQNYIFVFICLLSAEFDINLKNNFIRP